MEDKTWFCVSTLWEDKFSDGWSLPGNLSWYFDKCRRGYRSICFESSTRSRCVLPAISSSPDTLTISGAVTGAQWHSCTSMTGVKKISSKEPSGTTGVQSAYGRQVRRWKWPIMILLEISQHAVVEVRFLWCLLPYEAGTADCLDWLPKGCSGRELFSFSVLAASRLRGVVSNRSNTL